jgi:DNA polymerase-3 subunit gamma/tau
MPYKALYRKYRPATFEDVVGQQHIVRTLQNAIQNQKLAHAYLFCGPRGTGKTSVAKILAKTINCTGEGHKPCGKCANCVDIQEGTHPDVIELDAATNNGVDEIRDLIEKVKYAPMQGKYKVYIIDEVQMMTTGAFNALLKTLEEPPEYCIFVLATTEPHKVLPTIVSRCQRFDFNKLPADLIKGRLRTIVEQEGLHCDDDALALIAELADGGMRDALSVLDQCIAYAQDNITAQDVSTVYGIATTEEKMALLKTVKQQDAQKMIEMTNELAARGIDLQRLVLDLINIAKEAVVYDYSHNADLLEKISESQAQQMNRQFSDAQLLRYIDDMMTTLNNFRESADSLSYFEVCLLKMMEDQRPGEKTEKPAAKKKTAERPAAAATPQPAEVKPEPAAEPVPLEPEKPRQIKRLSDEQFLAILSAATKAVKEADAEAFRRVLANREDRYLPVIGALNGASVMADSEEDVIYVVDDRILADAVNEEENRNKLEELVEKEYGRHKNVTAVTRDQRDYLINYFRSHQTAPQPEAAEAPADDGLDERMASLFGANGYDKTEE